MKKINEYKFEELNYNSIRLNANESNSIFSKNEVIDILLDLDINGFNRYPDSNSIKLRKAYGNIIGYDYKKILAGNGSDQMIGTMISTYINRGDKILTLNPDFSMYDFYGSMNEGTIIKFDISKKGKFLIEDFITLGKESKPKVIIFSNPNNPTGLEISPKDIELLIESFKDVKVVIDEAYIEFGEYSSLNLIDKYKNLYITRTMSKAWGLAALRVGFIISNEDNIKELEKAMVPYSINTISQEIAVKILEYKEEMLENIEKIKSERNRMYLILKEIESESRSKIKFYKSSANFIFGRSIYKEELKIAFIDNNIMIRYFNDDSFRITIGEEEENDKVINIIRKVILYKEDNNEREKCQI